LPIVARTSASASLPIAALYVLLRCGSQVELDTAEPNDRDQRPVTAFCLQLDQPKVSAGALGDKNLHLFLEDSPDVARAVENAKDLYTLCCDSVEHKITSLDYGRRRAVQNCSRRLASLHS